MDYPYNDFSQLVAQIQPKYDSLGRKRHPKQENNRVKEYHAMYGIRMDREMMDRLKARRKGKRKVAELIRTYIEWGLENEE